MALITAKSIPEGSWNEFEWETWWKALNKEYKKEVAQQVFVAGWNEYGMWFPNKEFVDYMDSQGIDVSTVGSAVIKAGEEAVGFLTFPFRVGKVVLIGGLVFVGYILYKVAKETKGKEIVSLGKTFATKGRA